MQFRHRSGICKVSTKNIFGVLVLDNIIVTHCIIISAANLGLAQDQNLRSEALRS